MLSGEKSTGGGSGSSSSASTRPEEESTMRALYRLSRSSM